MKISPCYSVARFPQALEHFHFTGTGEGSEGSKYLPRPVVKMLSRKTAQNCQLAGVGGPANLSQKTNLPLTCNIRLVFA